MQKGEYILNLKKTGDKHYSMLNYNVENIIRNSIVTINFEPTIAFIFHDILSNIAINIELLLDIYMYLNNVRHTEIFLTCRSFKARATIRCRSQFGMLFKSTFNRARNAIKGAFNIVSDYSNSGITTITEALLASSVKKSEL